MLEYKTLQCRPEQVDATCQAMQAWGWKVEQTQEVYNENTEVISNETYLAGKRDIFGNYYDLHYESNPITQKNVTHYISIRLSRNKNMPNYERIRQLEEEYYNPKEKSPYVAIAHPSSKVSTAVGILCLILFAWIFALIGSILSHSSSYLTIVIVVLVVVIALFTPIIVVAHKNDKARLQIYNQEVQKNERAVEEYKKRLEERRTQIIKEVVTLLPKGDE